MPSVYVIAALGVLGGIVLTLSLVALKNAIRISRARGAAEEHAAHNQRDQIRKEIADEIMGENSADDVQFADNLRTYLAGLSDKNSPGSEPPRRRKPSRKRPRREGVPLRKRRG